MHAGDILIFCKIFVTLKGFSMPDKYHEKMKAKTGLLKEKY